MKLLVKLGKLGVKSSLIKLGILQVFISKPCTFYYFRGLAYLLIKFKGTVYCVDVYVSSSESTFIKYLRKNLLFFIVINCLSYYLKLLELLFTYIIKNNNLGDYLFFWGGLLMI